MKTIEQMAVEAELAVEQFGQFQSAWSEATDLRPYLTRFAALVAEQCAQVADNFKWFDHEDTSPDESYLRVAALIRAEFPKP